MAVPITFIIAVNMLFLILALEDRKNIQSDIYHLLSIFFGIIGYYISYTTDYLWMAYIAMAFWILSIFSFIYNIYTKYLPNDLWSDDEVNEYNHH